jgi:predicted aspartyl protease
MTVPVTIGSEGPFRFMIDTGAQATVLSRELADRLELFERKPAILVGMASREPVETTFVSDLGLGSRTFHIQSAPLLEGANIGGADGILGLDSLQNQRVLLDFDAGEMSVADAEQLGGNRGYEIVVRARERLGQLIITRARIDNIQVAVIVDTGAQGSVGNPALLGRLRRARHLGETTLTDVNGQVMGGSVKVARELRIGKATVTNFPLMFADSPTFHSLGLAGEPAMVLGMSELRLFRRVAIDFKERRVLLDLPAGAWLNDRRSGFRL